MMTGAITEDQMRWAAVLHCGESALLHGVSSLQASGLDGWGGEGAHVLAPLGVRVPPLDGVVVHRARDFARLRVCTRDGLPCTSVERALIDGASIQDSSRSAAGLVLAAIRQRLTTPDRLLDELEQVSRRRNMAALRTAALDARQGADAVSEVDTGRLLIRAGLTSFRRQAVISTSEGSRPVDFLVDLPDGTRLVVEVDGPRHEDPVVRAQDALKDAAAIAAGYAVLRLPLWLVRFQPNRVVRQLIALRLAAQDAIVSRNAS